MLTPQQEQVPDPSLGPLRRQTEVFLAAGLKPPVEPTVPTADAATLKAVQQAAAAGTDKENEPVIDRSKEVVTVTEAAKGADATTQKFADLLGAGRDTPHNQQSLNFVRSRGDLKTEIAEYRPLAPGEKEEKEEVTAVVDERLEELRELEAEGPLPEEAQKEAQLLEEIKENIKEGRELTEDQKQAVTALIDQDESKTETQKAELAEAVQSYRPLSQEQTDAFVLAVEESQELNIEQKEDLTKALREGTPLSDEQKEMVAEATEELEERIIKHDIVHSSIREADQDQLGSIDAETLSAEEQNALDKLLKQDLRLNVDEQATLVALSNDEKLDEQEQQALKYALKSQELTEDYTDRAIEAVQESALLKEKDPTASDRLTSALEEDRSLSTEEDKTLVIVALEEAQAREEATKLNELIDKASNPEQVAKMSNREIQKIENLLPAEEREPLSQNLREDAQTRQAIDPELADQLRQEVQTGLVDRLEEIETKLEPVSDVVRQDMMLAEQPIPFHLFEGDYSAAAYDDWFAANETTLKSPSASTEEAVPFHQGVAIRLADLDKLDLREKRGAVETIG